MIVATVAATLAWRKLLVCGLPEAFTSPTVVRYGDMPLVEMSGKALNCKLIPEVGAIPAWPDPDRPSTASPRKVPACAPGMTTSPFETRHGAGPAALLGKQRAHRFFVGDPCHRLRKKLSAGKLPYAFACARFIGKRNRVGDDDFIELRFGDARHGAARQHRVRAIRDHLLRAVFLQCGSRLAERVRSIHDVIHDQA